MEILGVIKALEILNPESKVKVYTDFKAIIDDAKQTIKPKKHLELWKKLNELKTIHTIEFVRIEKNSNENHTRAHEIARKVAYKMKARLSMFKEKR